MRLLIVSLAVVFGVSGVGCSGASGPSRHDLSGSVTFEGKPVPAGLIYFDPDKAQGNAGPQGAGEIKNGSYRTNPGFGTVGGPHTVRIVGWDGVAPSGPEAAMNPNGKRLFPEYVIVAHLPKNGGRMDFEVKSGE